MNKNQALLVELLASYIRDIQIKEVEVGEDQLEELLKIARIHDVVPLLYASLERYAGESIKRSSIFNTIKMGSVKLAMRQIQHISSISSVMERFNKESIPVIMLKGLVVREFYPDPEFRTMSDADILVKKVDFEKAKIILEELGYYDSGHVDPKHTCFIHKVNMPVELHWSPLNPERHKKNIAAYERQVWENAIEVEINKVKALSLSMEDLVLYICLHMAKHFFVTGFGLRQMIDLVVLVEANRDGIDWERLYKKAEEFSVSRFLVSLFSACNRLFKMHIPAEFQSHMSIDEKRIEIFTGDILAGGTFGGSSTERKVSNRIMTYVKDIDSKGIMNKIRNILRFLFPLPKKLGDGYSYARKFWLLLPIAWIHRFYFNLIRRDRGDVFKSFWGNRKDKNPLELLKKRADLINWIKDE